MLETLAHMGMWYALLIFGALFLIVGLLGSKGSISILNGKNEANVVLTSIGIALLVAFLIVWGAQDIMKGPTSTGVTTIDKLFTDLFSGVDTSPFKRP